MSAWLEGRVLENRHWTDTLFSLRVECARLRFEAGQFVRIALDVAGERIPRPFSFVNAPDDPVMEFYGVIVPEGPLSPHLARLKAGDALFVADNPSGFLVLAEVPPAEDLWLLATGTGIAPYLSILRTEVPWTKYRRVILVHGTRNANELVYQDMLREVAEARGKQFVLIKTTTREDTPGALRGRIPTLIEDGRLEAAAGAPIASERSQFMLCGNPDMLKDAAAALARRDLRKNRRRAPGQITVEEFLVRRWLVVVLALTLLSGCSVTRLAYNNADVFLRWQANHYLDFQDEQSDELDRVVAAFLAWHRSAALPQYARLADDAAARVLRGIRPEDLDWGYDAVRAQIREALGAAAGEAAGLLDRLSPEQIAHLEQRLAKDNREFAKDQIHGTMEDRHKRRVKRNVERLEEWFGSLSEAQVERVQRYSTRAPFSAELRLADRKRRQAEFIAMLRAREARRRLTAWLQDWEGGREPAYVEASRATRSEYVALLLDFDRTLAAEQREHLAARLKRFSSLFESLARQ